MALEHDNVKAHHQKNRGPQPRRTALPYFWPLFKRGVIGSFHKISAKHLSRYLAEFAYRFNYRESDDLLSMTLMCLLGKEGMPYRNVVASD